MGKVTTLSLSLLVCNSLFASCIESSLQQSYSDADVVFTGIVADKFDTCRLWLSTQSITKEEVSNNGEGRPLPPITGCTGGDSVARVEINEIYKDVWERLKESKDKHGVIVYAHSSTAGTYLIEGNEYLIFAKNPTYSMFLVGTCTGSKLLDYAAKEIAQLKLIKEAMNGAISP